MLLTAMSATYHALDQQCVLLHANTCIPDVYQTCVPV